MITVRREWAAPASLMILDLILKHVVSKYIIRTFNKFDSNLRPSILSDESEAVNVDIVFLKWHLPTSSLAIFVDICY